MGLDLRSLCHVVIRLGKVRSPAYGAVAQLAERLHGMQEVRGSIPLSSTK